MSGLLILSIILLALVSGAAGGYLAIRYLGRARIRTAWSPTGQVCETCGAPALPHRTHTGRWACPDHKAG